MSTDFENAVIAFVQSFDAGVSQRERLKRKRELLHIINSEYGEGNAYTNALKAIVERAYVGADALEPDRRADA